VGFFHPRDTASLIQVTVPGRDAIRASTAYDRILLYFQAARTQQRRIAHLIKNYDRSPSDPARRIAWNTIQEMFKVLRHPGRLSCIKPLFSCHRQLLKHYGDGRDALEHYQDRLPDGKRVRTMSVPSDLGNLHGSNFTFGGLEWDVGPSSIGKLKTIVKQLKREARREAEAKYQAKKGLLPKSK